MSGPESVDYDRMFEAIDKIENPSLREEWRYHLRLSQRAREQALLEDMGYDNCPVCRSNRLREAFA